MSVAGIYQPTAYPQWLIDQPDPPPACQGLPAEVFFPDHGQTTAAAKAICARCPRLDTCRDWALRQPWHELYGVWGGLSRDERKAIRLKERYR